MGDLKETIADGLKSRRAASTANDVVRKGELDTELASRPTSSEMDAAIAAITHDAVTVQNSDSLQLSVSGQEIIGSVRPATDGGLTIDGDGLKVDFGEGTNQAARGDHTHANDHEAVTGSNTTSANVGVSGQVVSVTVNLNPSGDLETTASGLRVIPDTFSPAAHTHTNATPGAAGFMSTADKVKLDGLTTGNTWEDSVTVDFTIGSSTNTAEVRYGLGLTEDANGLKVDFDEVSATDHTHEAVTGSNAGFMTAALYDELAAATYVYRAYADAVTPPVSSGTPTGFSETLDDDKHWEAIKISDTPIASPDAGDFDGLWQLLVNRRPEAVIGSQTGQAWNVDVLADQLHDVLLALRLIPS